MDTVVMMPLMGGEHLQLGWGLPGWGSCVEATLVGWSGRGWPRWVARGTRRL